MLVVAWWVAAGGCAHGGDTGTTDAPGFRPAADRGAEQEFIAALPQATLVVWPALVRTIDGEAHDPAIARVLADVLRGAAIAARVEMGTPAVPLPELAAGAPQFAQFQTELAALRARGSVAGFGTAHVVFLEILVSPRPHGGEAVGGIHCFVLTHDGRDAFSFLLNSHHRIMVDAHLRTDANEDTAHRELLARAAGVAGAALVRQIAVARPAGAGSAAE